MAIWPFIFLRDKKMKTDKVLINHEKIHLMQQKEMLFFLFFVWYFTEFFIRWMCYRKIMKAYRNISFEREAYSNDQDLEYIYNRKFWNFLSYMK